MTWWRGPAHVRLALMLLLIGAAGSGYAPPLASASPAASPVGAARPAPALAAATTTDTGILTLATVSPTVGGPGIPVTITGAVTGRNGALAEASVRVVLGTAQMLTRAQVATWGASNAAPTGTEIASAKVGPVASGATVPFTVTVPASRLSLSRPYGVIPIALQVRDLGSPTSSTSETLHTFVAWQRTKEYEPMRLAIAAPITLPPDPALFDADPATRTAAWQTQLGSGGPVARMLDGTDVTGPAGPIPVTWAVDPALLNPNAAASTTTDPIAPIVLPLQTRLATGAGRHTLWALPHADPDLAATVTADPSDPTVRREVQASTSLGAMLGVPVTTGVAWPVDGSFQAPREAALEQAYEGVGLSAVLGSASALPVTNGYTGQAPRRSASGLTLLAWDDVLSGLMASTTTPSQGAVTTQRVIAETATTVAESAGVSRSFLLAVPRTADPDPAALQQVLGGLAQTPWVQLVPTGDLQQQAATQDPVASRSAGSWDQAGPAQVDAARLHQIREERSTVDEVATVLGDNGAGFKAQWSTVLDQLVSARWRADPGGLVALDTAVTKASSAATSGITVADQTTNFLADEGTLQVTVANGLGVAVDGVRLVLQPTNPRLRIVNQPDPIRIEAGSRAVVRVKAQALAAGLTPVTATVTTADGTPIGVPGSITVRANPPGNSLYVVGGAVVLLILVLGTVRTLRRPPAATPSPRPAAAAPPAADPAATPPVPEDPAVASTGSPPSARRMSDDRS